MHENLEIWAGGQTGVDRAALDTALELGLLVGGWVPRGRLAEDGQVPAKYHQLREADTPDYAGRTRLNVEDTDATLVLTWGPATGGTLVTVEAALQLNRPFRQIDMAVTDPSEAAAEVRLWLTDLFGPRPSMRLNVAGPRATEAPAGYEWAQAVLRLALASPQL